MKQYIFKEYVHIYKFIFIKKWLKKFFWLIGEILINFHNKLQKKIIHMKKLFWKKRICNTNVK
jgi:hypothetical protein